MWDIIRERYDCTFFMITKRPERILDHLPADWNGGWDYVTIAVTIENQCAADRRLPVYLSVPMKHYAVMIEPILSPVNLCASTSPIYLDRFPGTGSAANRSRIYRWRIRPRCKGLRLCLGARYPHAVRGVLCLLLFPPDRHQVKEG